MTVNFLSLWSRRLSAELTECRGDALTIVPQPPNDIKSPHFSVKTTFRTLGVGYCIFADVLTHCPRKRVMFHVSRQRLTVTSVSECTSQICQQLLLSWTKPWPCQQWQPYPSGWQPSVPPPVQPLILDLRDLPPSCHLGIDWRGLQPTECGQWFHGHCQSIDTIYYHELGQNVDKPWYCAICGSPNSQTVFDLHGVDWTHSTFSDLSLNASCTIPTDLQFQPQHSSTSTRASQQDKWKERPLRVLNVNFQSARQMEG